MEVVLMLAGAESGHINWVVIVLGNLFVCGFEADKLADKNDRFNSEHLCSG